MLGLDIIYTHKTYSEQLQTGTIQTILDLHLSLPQQINMSL